MNTMTTQASNGAANGRYDDGIPERRGDLLPRVPPRTPAPKRRGPPHRQSSKQVIREGTTEPVLLADAAAELGVKPGRLYGAIHGAQRCNGVRYHWAPGSEPTPKPRHVPRKNAKAKSPDAPKPAPLKVIAPPKVELSAKELAMIVGAMARSGPVDAKSAEMAFAWAGEIRRQSAELESLLAGRAELFVADRIYIRPRAKA